MLLFLLNFSFSIYISQDNYSDIFNEHYGKHIFVALISDYCPHCKKIKPLFDQLETSYKNDDSISFGIIRCDQNRKLCKKFPDSTIVPSFYMVKGIIDNSEQYFGSINSSAIVSFIERKILPSYVAIKSHEDFLNECQKRNETSIFLIENFNQSQIEIIFQLQKEFKNYDVHFLSIQNNNSKTSFCNFYYPTNRTVCLDKSLTSKKIRKFVQKHLFPAVCQISEHLLNKLKEIKSPVLILSNDKNQSFEFQFRNLSSKIPGDLILSILDCDVNYKLCLKLMIQNENKPEILIYNPYKKFTWYYRGLLKQDLILNWVNNVISNKVRPTGPGAGFIGFIGNMFDISMEKGAVSFAFFVCIITVFVFMIVLGATNSYHRKKNRFNKFD